MSNREKSAGLKETLLLSWRAIRILNRALPGVFIAKLLAGVTSAVTPYAALWFSAQILNEIAGNSDPQRLFSYVLLTLAITALLQLLSGIFTRWQNACEGGQWVAFNHILAEKFQSMDFADMDDQKTHELISQIQQNDNWSGYGLRRFLYFYFDSFISGLTSIIASVGLCVSLFTLPLPENSALLWLDHPLTQILFILILLIIAMLAPLCATAAEKVWASNAKTATQGNRFFSFFGFMALFDRSRALDIRMYEQSKICEHYTDRMINDEHGLTVTMARHNKGRNGLLHALAPVISVSFTLLAYVYVCTKSWGGAFPIGSITQYVGAITSFGQGAILIAKTVGGLINNVPFLRLVYQFLDIPNAMYQGSLTTEKRSDRKYEVEFRDVSFRYPGSELWALRHVNMKFTVGQRLAVVGMNGSGKTTFIKLLCRLYDPQEGEILLNGINIKKYNYDDYMGIFSVVFQDFQLLALSLGENVAAGRNYDRIKTADCLRKAGFGDRLDALPLGLDTPLYREIAQDGIDISGGEAQKIAIARALYKDAPFIILDEPTAALDPIAEDEIYKSFNDIIGDKTAVYISHRLSSCRFCDEILVFDGGRIVQQGSHDALVEETGGKYHELWTAQAQYYTKTEK